MTKMTQILKAVSALVCVLLVFSSGPAHGAEGISVGENLPPLTLMSTDSPKTRAYLGLDNASAFSVSQISAKIVIVELFSLYCTVCQRQAPIANKIYKSIRGNKTLDQDIKMIGIGVGNNQNEIGVYRSHYRVPFPLCPDPFFDIHKKLGEPRTPLTMVVTRAGKVLMTHAGIVEDLDGFLGGIRKLHKEAGDEKQKSP